MARYYDPRAFARLLARDVPVANVSNATWQKVATSLSWVFACLPLDCPERDAFFVRAGAEFPTLPRAA